jgi:hypothetical protein
VTSVRYDIWSVVMNIWGSHNSDYESTISWDVTLCSLAVHRISEGYTTSIFRAKVC